MSDWSIITAALNDGRHELHLSGDDISTKLQKNDGGLPPALYQLSALNYLEISQTTLEHVDDNIEKLVNLINLALHRNEIFSIPSTINALEKLKFLDLSYNNLTTLPQLSLATLHTFNLSNNKLTDLPNFNECPSLNILFIDHNQLKYFPEGVDTLTELKAAKNNISELPVEIKVMQLLKNLDLSENKLQYVASELSQCKKLKNLQLSNNPLKDNRLKKMTTQCSTKAILDYVAKQSTGGGGGGKKKGKGKSKQQHVEEDDDVIVKKIFILQNKEDERRVVMKENVKEQRAFICCCVVKQLDLSDQAKFKSFISFQTKLHENQCDMRTKATIATHKLSELKFPLSYEAMDTTTINIKALGKQKETSAALLLDDMKREREALKLKKKRNVKTGLYKFLDLVEGKDTLACLKNSDNEVISLPPMTNSEVTKIGDCVQDVFIEITSPTSLPQCKYVMEELIKGVFQQDFLSKDEVMQGLIIEPIRVVDESGDLRCLYPSKIDLELKGIQIVRSDAQ